MYFPKGRTIALTKMIWRNKETIGVIVNAVEKAQMRFFDGGPLARRRVAHAAALTMNSSAKAASRLSAAFYAAVLKRSLGTPFQLLRL